LEASLEAFERGIGLARTCQKTLDQAEQRVQILSAKSADAELEPFADHV
ncbi:MAG TPA: exodeoxyribonuclease VII small subunit, partial [Chromatiaceae bacterium]|nr:exodeoxyribonuclease VII small subunit [Chromatiaceae bacterium]